MSETEMKYMAKFSLDTSDLTKGITGAAISFDAVMIAAKEAFAMIKEGYDMTVGKAIEWSDSIHKLSVITGSSEENIQRLQGAAIATGTNFEAVSATIKMFSQRLSDAGDSGLTLRSRLADIGVAVKDSNGQYRDASELYMEINSRMNEMTSTFERNNLAMDVYGRNWASIADMISMSDRAATAFKNVDLISEKDIADAKELGIQLGIIEANFSKLGVKAGLAIMDVFKAKGAGASLVNGPGGSGFLDQMVSEMGENELKKANKIIAPLVDTYGNLQGKDFELAVANKELTLAQKDLNEAMGGGTQEAVDKASIALVEAKAKVRDVLNSMVELKKAFAEDWSKKNNTGNVPGITSDSSQTIVGYDSNGEPIYSTNPYANNTSGGDIGSFNMNKGAFANTLGIWSYADNNTDATSQSNPFLSQIRAIAQQARSIQLPGGATWMNSSESGNFENQTRALWQQYQEQKAGSQGFTQINYIQGDNAQQVANAIAEATSRAMARKVSL